MLKVIGAITLFGVLVFGAAYFGGFVEGSAEVNVTPKGRQAARDGITEVQKGVSKGLERAADAVAGAEVAPQNPQ